jgi:hypothetical protein
LRDYVNDERRRNRALKRKPTGELVSFDIAHEALICPATASPEQAFNHAWASRILDNVISGLREEYSRNGKETHWGVFQEKALDPILTGQTSPPYEDLCRKYAISDPHKAAAMVTTVKRRFRSFLRQAVRPYVECDADIDDEISELFDYLSRKNA